MLKNKLLNTLILTALSAPGLAMAADASPFSTNVSLVSDYLYRGISQTGAKPAIQGGFDYAGSNGLYAGVWGSSISWLGDGGYANNAGTELDTYAGYRGTASVVSYDVGFLRYNYPGNYLVATKADTNEIYGALTYSIVTAKLSYSLGDLFGDAGAKGSTYFDLSANYPVGNSGYTVGAHYGKQTVAGTGNDIYSYTDYKLSVAKDLGTGYGVSAALSNTNAGAAYTVLGNKLGKSTLVLSLSRTF